MELNVQFESIETWMRTQDKFRELNVQFESIET
jgi:hypothetical protein